MPLDRVPPLEEIRRRVIRELVDADIQSAGRKRPPKSALRRIVHLRAGQLIIRVVTRARRLR